MKACEEECEEGCERVSIARDHKKISPLREALGGIFV